MTIQTLLFWLLLFGLWSIPTVAATTTPTQNSLFRTSLPLLTRDMIPLSERSLSYHDGQNIFVIDAPGDIPTNITNNSTLEPLYALHKPLWSVKGIWVAYMTINQETLTTPLWITDRDGNSKIRIEQDGMLIGWSPTREQLAYFQPMANNTMALKIFDVNTQSYSTIFSGMLVEAKWSSDGNNIAFTYHLPDQAVQLATWTMFGDAGDTIRILATASKSIEFTWSPVTDIVAFARNDSRDFGDIFIAKRNGTQLQQLTFTNDEKQFLEWSPDALALIYTSRSTGTHDEGIYTVLINDREIHHYAGFEGGGHWTGDGRFIGFATSTRFTTFPRGGGSPLSFAFEEVQNVEYIQTIPYNNEFLIKVVRYPANNRLPFTLYKVITGLYEPDVNDSNRMIRLAQGDDVDANSTNDAR